MLRNFSTECAAGPAAGAAAAELLPLSPGFPCCMMAADVQQQRVAGGLDGPARSGGDLVETG